MDARQVVVFAAILVVTVALCSGSTYSITARNAIIQKRDDVGHVVPCAKDDPPINLTWSPKNITVGDTVTLNLDFVLPVSMNSGMAVLSLIVDGEEVQMGSPFKSICQKMLKYFNIKCPLKKGDKIHIHNYKVMVPDYFDIQPEKATLSITNGLNKRVLCIEAKPHIIVPEIDYRILYGDIY